MHADGEIQVGKTQRNRGAILEENKVIRNNGLCRNMEWGAPALRIPEVDYIKLVKKYPDLASRDNLTRSLAWKKFLQSTESTPYRLDDRHKARLRE